MKKCRQAARMFLKRNLPINILVCNSGIMMVPFALSADNIEIQFAVNHMGVSPKETIVGIYLYACVLHADD